MIAKLLRKKGRKLKRQLLNKRLLLLLVITVACIGAIGYAGYMQNKRLIVNPDTYKPLLQLIAQVESKNNYNAYFGKPNNTEIDFTKMSIAEVLRWQAEYVNQGNFSSAVGRYQIVNTTLDGLVRRLNINTSQKFDQAMQDRLAIALLERRGAEAYINNEITQEQFAANLAMEWAALPKVIGEKPADSYYSSDGVNKALVSVDKVMQAIEPIEAKP